MDWPKETISGSRGIWIFVIEFEKKTGRFWNSNIDRYPWLFPERSQYADCQRESVEASESFQGPDIQHEKSRHESVESPESSKDAAIQHEDSRHEFVESPNSYPDAAIQHEDSRQESV